MFNHYGAFIVQAYDLEKFKTEPESVVSEFLRLPEKHK